MEYFRFVEIPQYIMQFFRGANGGISLDELYILLGIAGGAYLFCLILGGLSLYVMAERAGVKHSWLGFVPFANTYYAGKVAGDAAFFGKKKRIKWLALGAMLAEIAYVLFEVLAMVSSMLIANPSYYETNYSEGAATLILNLQSVPAGLRWMVAGSQWFTIFGLLANLVMLVLMCAVYMGIFRKYSPRNSFWLTVLAVLLPVRAIVLFAIRNNGPVDYGEYMQKRIEEAMRSAGVEIGQGEQPGADPFEDFANRNSSPFEEFEDTPFDSPFDLDDYPDQSNHSDDGDESHKE